MEIKELQNKELREACRKYAVSKLYVFGSVAEGTSVAESDIDFVVEFERSGYEGAFEQFMGLKERLEEIFDRPVDLISSKKFRNPVFEEELKHTKSLVYAS